MAKDYYDILGVSKSATADEIKRAYRKLALKHHPDRGGNHDEFTKINEAYQILSDPQKRAQYDQFGSTGANFGQGGSPYGGGGYSQGFNGQDFEFNFGGMGGLGDIFGDFFSQAFSTIQAEIEISPSQAVLGDKLEVNVAGEHLTLDIPSGVQDGTQFRVAGRGRKTRSGERGDLIIAVRIKMPKKLTEEQKELWEKLREAESKKKSSWWHRQT
jgi:DnaJ-class molecular chaperone